MAELPTPLDESTERLIMEATGFQSNAAILVGNALRNRIRELVEEARQSGVPRKVRENFPEPFR